MSYVDPICEDSAEQVMREPAKGDALCFDGEVWRVTRRHGWHYPVPDPHLGVNKPSCPRCGGKLDPDTGRHIDDEGQVMDYREDLIQCRPDPDPEQVAYWTRRMADAGIATAPIPLVRYIGFDMVTPPDDASGQS